MSTVMCHANTASSACKNYSIAFNDVMKKSLSSIYIDTSVQSSEATYFKLKAFLTFLTNTNKYLKLAYITKSCLHNRQYTNHIKSYDKRSIPKYHTVLYSNRNPEYDCKTEEISIYLEIRHQQLYFKMYLYLKY